MPITLAKNLVLPDEAVTETFGILAMKGRGKTYTATKLFEEMYEAGAQVVALDPVGNWRFLRVAANGKDKGLDVPVFGGPHGDLPLEATSGRFIAKVIVDRHLSVILDVSRFRKNDRKRFVTDLAEEMFELKKDDPTPMHFFIEEARMFVPQKMFGPDEARMLGAFEDIVRLGRNYGIGASLIDQRPQSVNKDVLSQVSVLIALGLSGKLERKEVEDWVRAKEVEGADALRELATLQPGEAFVWSPAFLKTFQRVHIAKKATFDGSATPKLGQAKRAAEVKPLAEEDLVELRQAMAGLVEKVKESDPRHLKAEVARLRTELEKATSAPVIKRVNLEEANKPVVTYVPTPVITKEDFATLGKLVLRIEEVSDATEKLMALAGVLMVKVAAAQKTFMAPRPPSAPSRATHVPTRDVSLHVTANMKPPSNDSHETNGLGRKQVEMLLALTARAEGLGRSQLALLSVMSESGTFGNYISELTASGFIEKRDGRFFATDAGHDKVARVPGYGMKKHIGGLVEQWEHRFSGKVRAMLQNLLDHAAKGFTRSELAAAVEMTESGTFGNYLSELNKAGVIEKRDGRYFASPTFWE